MTYRLIATTDQLSKISDPFDTFEDAVQFGRDHWAQMKKAHVRRIEVRNDSCGESDVLFPPACKASEVPIGYYGYLGKRYHADRPDEGKWAGWTFLSTGSDYHDRKTIAMARPDGVVVKSHRVFSAILADPFQRAAEYGQITGTCASCGRKLEDPVSRSIGMGPICRKKFGVA